ncbi:MAG: hypothetical protein WEB58_21225 [Planctomycetaceae bacterium]
MQKTAEISPASLTDGEADDCGYNITENPVQLGIDHERLTYWYQGEDFRLTDIHGEVARGILG